MSVHWRASPCRVFMAPAGTPMPLCVEDVVQTVDPYEAVAPWEDAFASNDTFGKHEDDGLSVIQSRRPDDSIHKKSIPVGASVCMVYVIGGGRSYVGAASRVRSYKEEPLQPSAVLVTIEVDDFTRIRNEDKS